RRLTAPSDDLPHRAVHFSARPPVLHPHIDPPAPDFVILMTSRPPPSTLFPYTTLFRSLVGGLDHGLEAEHEHVGGQLDAVPVGRDRKSTRLNSSHVSISYAVFCLKKKIRPGVRDVRQGRDRPCCVRRRPGQGRRSEQRA